MPPLDGGFYKAKKMSKKFKHIMIDLETLGTRADAVIMSIGAVKFDLETGEIDENAFYASISIDSNHDVKPRHISESTMIWWLQQSPEAQRVFSEAKTTLLASLEDLQDWFDHPDYIVWSNGADFDIPMAAHAYSTHGLTAPWKFWNTRCFRTIKNLPGAPAGAKQGVAHNALDNAISQTKHLQKIWEALFTPIVVSTSIPTTRRKGAKA